MDKAQLIDCIASDAGITKADAKKALDATIKAVSNTLKKGNALELKGFGKLEVHQHKKRSWRTRKGKLVTIPAHKSIFFHAGEDLNGALG